jgi:hypothetical protein
MVVKTEFDLLMRLVRDYFSHGYYRYQIVSFPVDKDFEEVKERLEKEFNFTNCRTTRMRRRALGFASGVILYYKNNFYILVTEGKNIKVESENFLDIRETTLRINKYVIKLNPYKNSYKATVYLEPSYQGSVKRIMKTIAVQKKDKVIKRFRKITPYTFDGINKQMRGILEVVNRKRKKAGVPRIQIEEIIALRDFNKGLIF